MNKQLKHLAALACFIVLTLPVRAQTLTGISTRWADEFTEWEIFTTDEYLTGEIRMRWPGRLDWTQWEFRLGDVSGLIRQAFKDDPNQWNITCHGENITARVIYRGDLRQWRITNNEQQFTLVTKWGNIADEWLVKEEANGIYDIFTVYEGDPRDWEIVDEMDETVSLAMRITFAFITIINSTPKF